MSVLVLAEDKHYEPIQVIARRAGLARVRVFPMRGNKVEKLAGWVLAFYSRYARFVVLKDLESYEESVIRERFQEALRRVEAELGSAGPDVRLVIVRRAVESWLLADPDAIEAVIGCKLGSRIRRSLERPEQIDKPKGLLAHLARRCGRIYNPGLSARIAASLDLNLARKRAPSLDDFLKAIAQGGQ